MALVDNLNSLVTAALLQKEQDGQSKAEEFLALATDKCTEAATQGLRNTAFPDPTEDADFLGEGAALALAKLLTAEGLSVWVHPYKDVNFYLDIHWTVVA
jgi:hypothetical protein